MFQPQFLAIFRELTSFQRVQQMRQLMWQRFHINMIKITNKIKILKPLKSVYGYMQYKIILIVH